MEAATQNNYESVNKGAGEGDQQAHEELDMLLEGQVEAWTLAFDYVSSMAVGVACVLKIPDILAKEGRPMKLDEIAAAGLLSPTSSSSGSPSKDYLYRLMRFLCWKGVFSHKVVEGGVHVYSLNKVSRWLVEGGGGDNQQAPPSLAPIARLSVNEALLTPWLRLPECIAEEGGPGAFERAHGCVPLFSFARDHPDTFGTPFIKALACETDIAIRALLAHYHALGDVHTLVDVGGNIGKAAAQIVARYPSIHAINFDLPHIVAQAPPYPGVEHTSGDMFQGVPSGDAIFLKHILHDWNNEDCIKILKNCHKALSEGGRLIIMDAVVGETDEKQQHPFQGMKMVYDLVMMTYLGSKERTLREWEYLLNASGFIRWNIIDLPCRECVIEAFPAFSAEELLL